MSIFDPDLLENVIAVNPKAAIERIQALTARVKELEGQLAKGETDHAVEVANLASKLTMYKDPASHGWVRLNWRPGAVCPINQRGVVWFDKSAGVHMQYFGSIHASEFARHCDRWLYADELLGTKGGGQ